MCFAPEDYVYASAGDYVGEIGFVSVELVCRGQSPLLITSHRFGEPATVGWGNELNYGYKFGFE
ncbi:MAG: hypothetical protein ACJAXX_003119 [Roseivirga sp.]|jgi:hypothetical protein